MYFGSKIDALTPGTRRAIEEGAASRGAAPAWVLELKKALADARARARMGGRGPNPRIAAVADLLMVAARAGPRRASDRLAALVLRKSAAVVRAVDQGLSTAALEVLARLPRSDAVAAAVAAHSHACVASPAVLRWVLETDDDAATPAPPAGGRGAPPAAYACRTGSTRQIGRLASVSGAYSLKSHAMPYSRANQP